MGNFDFRAFVAKQKEESRIEKEDKIIKESHKKILLAERLKRSARGTEMEFMIEAIMLDWASDKDILDEGLWSKMKHFGAKTLGAWEKGGGIWGRGERSEKAKAQYEKMLEKTAGGIVKKFMAQLGKDYPEFPNMESDEEFGKAIADIYTFYDSIKHAALTPNDVEGKPISVVQKAIDAGKIDVMMANQIIGDLRLALHKTLDYDLADVYKHFDESKKPEDDEEVLDEIFGFGKKKGWEAEDERQKIAAGEIEDPNAEEEEEEDVLSREKGDSASWKSLKSNLLPLMLGIGGATGVLGSILIKAGWFADLFDQVVQNPTKPVFKTFGETIMTKLSPEPGEGVTQMIGRIAEGNPDAFGPDASPQELFSALKELGIDPANPTELAQMSEDPTAFMEAWKGAVGSGAGTLGEMFPSVGGDISAAAVETLSKSTVGPTGAGFAAAIKDFSPEQLQQLGKRAQEIGNALVGQDIYSGGVPGPKDILRVASDIDPNLNMVSGTSKSLLALNVAAQEIAAGIPAEDIVATASEGAGGPGALGLKLGKSAISTISKTVLKQVAKGGVKTGVKAGVLGSAATASTMLGALGVALGVSAAGVKALRLKGQHSSRLEKLQRLRDAMDDLKDSPFPPVQKPTQTEEPPEEPPTQEPKTQEPKTPGQPLGDIEVGDFVIVKNKKGQEILTKVSEMPQGLQEKNQWEEEGNVFITGGDWSIPLGGRRGYSSKGQKWIAVKDGEVQIRKAEPEDFTKAVETDSKVATKMGVDKMDHEAEFGDEESQNIEYSKFQERLANDQRIWGDDSEPTISPEEMTTIFKAIKDYAGEEGHFQRFIMHGTDQGAGAKVDGDFLPDASKTADSLDEAKVQDLELKGVVNLLAKSIVPKLETNVPKKLVMAAIIDSLIKAKMLITHKGKRLKKSPKFKSRMKPTKYNPDMDVPKGEMGKGPAPRAVPKELEEILKRINQRLRKANKKQITVPQLLEYLKSRKKKLLK
jgi:hypothetical protein